MTAPSDPANTRLDSWKDIAAYMKRDVSTVQRWEKREGMPVHRHLHDRLGSVYAFTAELDAWTESRRTGGQALAPDPSGEELDPKKAPSRVPRLIAAVAIAAIAVALVFWLTRSRAQRNDNPLASARFVRVTDFEGTEQAAAISPDGRLVAFVSDREGPADVWITQPGTGQFHNLTRGSLAELVNPDIRTLGFSPDGSSVSVWVRKRGASSRPDISIWTIPTLGGEPKLFLEGAAELDWSSDAKLVYHTPAPGDPLFLRQGDAVRPLFTAPAGIHNHYPVWSPDDSWIYFVMGSVPDKMDVWRIRADGASAERVTKHNSRVTSLTFIDRHTLLYLATESDGDGPWLYVLDTENGRTKRVSFGVERYTSIDASADGRRLVATVANPRRALWRVTLGDEPSTDSAASRMTVPVVGARSPRFAGDALVCVATRGDTEGIWRVANGTAKELWSGTRIIGGPAVSPDGVRIAFSAGERLYLMNADGSGVRAFPLSLRPRSAPAWSPDGQRIAVGTASGLVITSLRTPPAVLTVTPESATDPVWSADGSTLLYAGQETGTTFPIRAVHIGGRPVSRLTLSRGVRRIALLPKSNMVVVLRGDMVRKDFWAIDLETGRERRLTSFGSDFVIGDFDVSPDGGEIVFDREQDNSDIVLIDR